MNVNLNGWTKLGDNVSATGKWVVYRFKGKEFDTVDVLESFSAEETEKASKLYQSEVSKMKRGAAWLVTPEGKVSAMLFIRPGEIR